MPNFVVLNSNFIDRKLVPIAPLLDSKWRYVAFDAQCVSSSFTALLRKIVTHIQFIIFVVYITLGCSAARSHKNGAIEKKKSTHLYKLKKNVFVLLIVCLRCVKNRRLIHQVPLKENTQVNLKLVNYNSNKFWIASWVMATQETILQGP